MPKAINSEEPLQRHLESFSNIPRGNMYVKFNIVFPTNFTNDQKTKILAILEANRQELARESEDE